MMAGEVPRRLLTSTAFSLGSNNVASASWTTGASASRLKFREGATGELPSTPISLPVVSTGFTPGGVRVGGAVRRGAERARTIIDGGMEGRPILGAYNSAEVLVVADERGRGRLLGLRSYGWPGVGSPGSGSNQARLALPNPKANVPRETELDRC